MAGIRIKHRFIPLRLAAMTENSVDVVFTITNETERPILMSIDAIVHPRALIGFDPSAINKRTFKKVGTVEPSQTVEVPIKIYGTNQTKPGVYPILFKINIHDRDYNDLLHEIRRRTELRVV